jgi:type II secretory pathway component PulJ
MKRLLKNQRGDTIVEVLLAITVLSTVLSIAYSLAARSFRTLQFSRDHMQATLILQEQAEGLRAMRDELGYAPLESQLGAAAGNFVIVPQTSGPDLVWTVLPRSSDPLQPANLHPNAALYHVDNAYISSDPDGDGVSDTLTVTLRLTWDRIGGGTDSQTLVTRLRNI